MKVLIKHSTCGNSKWAGFDSSDAIGYVAMDAAGVVDVAIVIGARGGIGGVGVGVGRGRERG